jgi:hypothetical protein
VCLEILGQSHRHQRVAALLTPDATDSDFWNARVVARDLGIDTFEVTLRRIGQNSAAARGDRQRSRPRARSWAAVGRPMTRWIGASRPCATIRALAAIC